ncbi:WG repeat-containing protein [Intestinibacillus massiliensis]|nr:WG repeat-containing protein [Intestinibacillus massiliensis]
MKKVAAIALAALLAAGSLPGAQAAYREELPFVFDSRPTYAAGGLVECITREDNGLDTPHVYTRDGKRYVLSEPTAQEVLVGGYICAQLPQDGKWTVFRPDGGRALAGAYDRVDVYGDMAFGWIGNWHPPGFFLGKAEVFDLKAGEKLLPGAYDLISAYQDGKLLSTAYYTDPGPDGTLQDVRQMWDADGNDVTAALGYTVDGALVDGYLRVRSVDTGKFGVVDAQGNVCVPMQYDAIGDANGQGAIAVRRDGEWQSWGAVRIADGSQVVPVAYTRLDMLPGDIIAGKGEGWVRDADGNPVTLFDSYGRQIPADGCDACSGRYGGVIYVQKGGALQGIDTGGNVLVGPVKGGFLSFCVEGYDVVLIGRYGESDGGMIVGKDGTVLAPFDTAALGSVWEHVIELQDYQTAEYRMVYSDGTPFPASADVRQVDDIHTADGWVLYRDYEQKTAWVTGLDGMPLIPKGVFTDLGEFGDYYFPREVGGDRTVAPAFVARNQEGKYGTVVIEADVSAQARAAVRTVLPLAMHYSLPRPLGGCVGRMLAQYP